jgi:hypothetical protein
VKISTTIVNNKAIKKENVNEEEMNVDDIDVKKKNE